MKFKIAALIISVVLAGCAPGSETKLVEKIVPVEKKDTVVTGLDSDPEASEFKIVATKNYDGEKLFLNFKPNRTDLRIVSIRRSKSSKATESTKFEDLNVIDSSEATDILTTEVNDISPWDYTYEFVVSHPSFKERETITLDILQEKSFIVRKNTKISELTIGSNEVKLESLTMSKDATFTLNGPSLKLSVKNFIAEEGSSIENMAQADSEIPAKESEPGKDGGVIRFEADNASGTLKIFLRGGKGGGGSIGEKSTAQGPQGPHGSPGAIKYPNIPRDPIVLSSPRNKKTLVIKRHGYADPFCILNPGPGGKGGRGPQGGAGGPGAKGGETGSMDLSINNGTLRYTVELIPGAGGNGGKGGGGGPGGPPGNPGDTIYNICPAAGNLGQGDEGPEGPAGPTGYVGSFGKFCTFRNGTNFSCVTTSSYAGEL